MRDGSSFTRRADLKAALRRAKPDDVLPLEAIARIWGVTKQRFVTVRNLIEESIGFPAPRKGQGNEYVYPARKAIEAMLAYEMRHEAAATAKADRTAAILGQRRQRRRASSVDMFRPNDMATLARMSADIEAREREQGLYAPIAEIAAVAGDVFGALSEFIGTLSNKIDPHGLLPAETRAMIDANGADALMGLHSRMKDLLSSDAKPRGSRTPARRSRRA